MSENLKIASDVLKDSNAGAPQANLASPGIASLVSARIKYEIDEFAISTYYEPFRWHLGASVIGHECSRYLWYSFRWCKADRSKGETPEEKHANHGRMLRLFNRGHLEENRYIAYLRGIGFEVLDKDPATGKQWVINACQGHFGGSGDAVVKFPSHWKIEPQWALGEFKTNSTGSGFNKLKEIGVNVAKQQHFTQQSVYGTHLGLQWSVYLNTNKNDDDMHVEVCKINTNLGQNMIYKAERIITSETPPNKYALDEKHMTCSYCDFRDICHKGAPIDKNCRSCKHAQPVANGEWRCNQYSADIPREVVWKGCDSWSAIV